MGENTTRVSSCFIVFFILLVAFSLISAGIFKDNTAIGIAAYAKKSKESSGGRSDNGGGSSGSSGDNGGSNGEGGGSSSDKGSDNTGSSTGENNNPTIEEPPPPPSPTEEPTPTPEPPTPPLSPPLPTCEQGSTSPECANVPPPPPPVDCTTNPSDPSCPPPPPTEEPTPTPTPTPTSCPPVALGISCSPVDCTKTPNDPSCPPPPTCKSDEIIVNGKCEKKPPIHIDCPVRVGFTLRAIENGKCVYDPIKCKQDEHLVNNKCEKITCPPGFHLQKGVCTKNPKNIIINVKKKVTTTYETIFRNIFVNPNQPKYLLLLDTAQLCQLAGDTQCVAKQNQFDTLNLVTKLDSTGKTWTISGQVENRAVSKIQRNVQVVAYFYDSKGNNVGGPYKGTVNPTVLKSLQLGAFSMKPSTSIMKGTPSFIRLEYQSSTAT